MKKHDELVEEIRLLWCEECVDGPLHSETNRIYHEGWEKVCASGAEDLCRERARKVITLILSAVRDGRLDEELGVIGRWARSRSDPKKLGLQSWSVIMSRDKGATLFIALSGTSQRDPVGGKVEEASDTNIPRYCEHCGSEEHYTSEH